MTKEQNHRRLYEVSISGGTNNRNWQPYFDNVTRLNGKSPDFSITRVALISHHVDADTLKMLCTENFRRGDEGKVTVIEVTNKSLKGRHAVYSRIRPAFAAAN